VVAPDPTCSSCVLQSASAALQDYVKRYAKFEYCSTIDTPSAAASRRLSGSQPSVGLRKNLSSSSLSGMTSPKHADTPGAQAQPSSPSPTFGAAAATGGRLSPRLTPAQMTRSLSFAALQKAEPSSHRRAVSGLSTNRMTSPTHFGSSQSQQAQRPPTPSHGRAPTPVQGAVASTVLTLTSVVAKPQSILVATLPELFDLYRADFGRSDSQLLTWVASKHWDVVEQSRISDFVSSRRYTLQFDPFDWTPDLACFDLAVASGGAVDPQSFSSFAGHPSVSQSFGDSP